MSSWSRYCHRCGAALPAGAGFCPNCGTAAAVTPATAQVEAPSPPSQGAPESPYYHRHRHEKEEKQEKHEKHEKGEKGRGDLAGALTGGLILILLGVLLYFSIAGNTAINAGNFWEYFIIGVGIILILQGIVRYVERGRSLVGSFIGGAVLVVFGLALVSSSSNYVWPLILVVLGVAAIASAFTARRRVPVP